MRKVNKNCHLYSILCSVLLFFIFLPSYPIFAQEIEIKDGVKYIHNEGKGKWADDPNVNIEYLGTLGEIEDSDENYMFYLPKWITGDNEGNIYVLDAGNHRVQKYDKDHNFILSFGNRGQGPGEFMLPTHIEVDHKGNITVFDNGNRRFETFSPDGDYISSIRKQETTFSFRHLSTGEILVRNPGVEGYRSFKSAVPKFYVLDSELKQIRTLGETKFYGEDTHQKYSGINRFSFTVDENDNIYTALLFQNRIEKYNYDGELVFVIDRPFSEKLYPTRRKDPFSAGNTVGIDIDSRERIWVLAQRNRITREETAGTGIRSDGNGNSEYWIWGNPDIKKTDVFRLELYNPDGVLLKTFTLDHFVDALKIIDDKIYILERIRGMQFHIYDININR